MKVRSNSNNKNKRMAVFLLLIAVAAKRTDAFLSTVPSVVPLQQRHHVSLFSQEQRLRQRQRQPADHPSSTRLYQSTTTIRSKNVTSSASSADPTFAATVKAMTATSRTTASAAEAAAAAVESKPPSKWDSFDYEEHWYPCAWACDVPKNQPFQLTLFDVDYAVVIHDPDDELNPKKKKKQKKKKHDTLTSSKVTVTAVVDQCPHRAALLSEGRVTESGHLQCAYHGWSFNMTSGACVDVPQSQAPFSKQKSPRTSISSAIPATLHQGLIWLWPGPKSPTKDPYTIPELDDPEFSVMSPAIRDFPMIDWTLLISNILDPDHGLFAHQSAPFDWYGADKGNPIEVEESFDNNGWTMKSRVTAVDKITVKHQQRVEEQDEKLKKKNSKKKKKDTGPPPMATSMFVAPSVVTLARRSTDDPKNTKNVACFWVCPVGTGRCRFLSAAAFRKSPFSVPRWLNHIILNGFLDQDSLLVASQQPPTLRAEAAGHTRSNHLFVYQSPTDRTVRRIDRFWDATLSRAPNRLTSLISNVHNWNTLPPREVVLDRKSQHLDVCPDSQDAVRNSRRIRNASYLLAAAWLILKTTQASSSNIFVPKIAKSVVWPILSLSTAWLAELVRSKFYYTYSKDMLQKDLHKIPQKIWSDPLLQQHNKN